MGAEYAEKEIQEMRGCCPTHDSIRATTETIRVALLAAPMLAISDREWLLQKLIQQIEREAIAVEREDGTVCLGIGQAAK